MKFIFKSIMYIAMVWAKPDNSLNKNFTVFAILVLKLYSLKIVRFFLQFICPTIEDFEKWKAAIIAVTENVRKYTHI